MCGWCRVRRPPPIVSRRRLDATDRAPGEDCSTPTGYGAGQRRRRPVRLRPTIRRGMERAAPLHGGTTYEPRQLVAIDQTRARLVVLGKLGPGGVALELLVVVDQVQDAVLAVSQILADLVAKIAPDAERLDDHRHLAGIPTLLTDPAPVAPRLLTGDVTLLAHHDVDALLGEEPGRGYADDSAADDHDFRGGRNRGGRLQIARPGLGDKVEWHGLRHGISAPANATPAHRRDRSRSPRFPRDPCRVPGGCSHRPRSGPR